MMSFSLAIEGTGSLQSTLLISVWISGLHSSEFIVLSVKKKKIDPCPQYMYIYYYCICGLILKYYVNYKT